VQNVGQVDERVKYHLKMAGTNVYFTPEEIVYQFILRNEEEGKERDRYPSENNRESEAKEEVRAENVRLKHMGANISVKIEGLEES
jgi:hypothetical protein